MTGPADPAAVGELPADLAAWMTRVGEFELTSWQADVLHRMWSSTSARPVELDPLVAEDEVVVGLDPAADNAALVVRRVRDGRFFVITDPAC